MPVQDMRESPEVLFAHTAGLRVVACSDAADAFTMIQQSISSADPVIFFEQKRRYWDKAEVDTAASSVVAQATPAAPRSWMPTTRPAANSSRQHSTSSFSRNGSPTWTLGRFAALPRRGLSSPRSLA